MTKAIIIGAELPANQNLNSKLKEVAPGITVTAMLPDVAQSVQYFSHGTDAHLVFCDVQLTDGLSFTIFKKAHVNLPVIFLSACDQYLAQAFDCNCIDYLRKPVSSDHLLKAVNKYYTLGRVFSGNYSLQNEEPNLAKSKKPKRLDVKSGQQHLFLTLEDIVLFYTENKVVYIVDKNGAKYMADKNLCDLEATLDAALFFRANRQYIVNVNYIKGYKTFERVKLQLDLHLHNKHSIVISQEMAPVFKKWICNI